MSRTKVRSLLNTFRLKFNSWTLWTLLFTIVVSVPLLILFLNFNNPSDEVWSHIVRDLLPGYVSNTLILMTGVASITIVIGVGTAWICSAYDFPGRNFFRWALILPIALPGYISGFTWAGILDYTSPVYVFFRNHLGIETGQFLFFNVLSMPGAIIILSLSLYPYVYLITRSWFEGQSASMLEVSASLGRSRIATFFYVALPMARPAIVAGVSLALMEVLNDYGLVRYFGVDTFTTGIFSAWFAFSNSAAAMKLSAYLMLFVLVLIATEKFQRRRMRYVSPGNTHKPLQRQKLSFSLGVFATLFCSIPFLLGFLFPVSMLVYWAQKTAHYIIDSHFIILLANSFVLASIAALVVVFVALVIAFTVRTFPSRFIRLLSQIATLGYAIPGAVVAIGLLIALLWLDAKLAFLSSSGFRLAFTGTWFALIYAYLVRFMAVGYNGIESGFEKIPITMDESSRSLGRTSLQTLALINFPLLRASVFAAALLVFIDVLKELPLTLILRPFNFDTLAIRAFEFASDERIAEAAPAALVVVLVGVLPVIVMNRILGKSDRIKL